MTTNHDPARALIHAGATLGLVDCDGASAASQYAALLYLADRADRSTGEIPERLTPDAAELGRAIYISERQARRVIDALATSGRIVVAPRPGRRSRLRVVWLPVDGDPGQSVRPEALSAVTPCQATPATTAPPVTTSSWLGHDVRPAVRDLGARGVPSVPVIAEPARGAKGSTGGAPHDISVPATLGAGTANPSMVELVLGLDEAAIEIGRREGYPGELTSATLHGALIENDEWRRGARHGQTPVPTLFPKLRSAFRAFFPTLQRGEVPSVQQLGNLLGRVRQQPVQTGPDERRWVTSRLFEGTSRWRVEIVTTAEPRRGHARQRSSRKARRCGTIRGARTPQTDLAVGLNVDAHRGGVPER